MIEATGSDTVGDSVYRNIRNDIIFGQLKPSERMRLEPLRKRYGVSVTTLREILNRLTSDGFVVAEGQKGFEVAPVSDDDLRELAELRILLESHALKRSFELGDLDWEAGVAAAYHKLQVLEKKMLAGETTVRERWKNADWQFHRALITGCGSRALLETHGAVFDKYLRYQMLTLTFRGDEAAREHKMLFDAALSHDAATAAKILETHILGGVEHSIANRDRKQSELIS
ncbi:GntR family transcriptional regulator [Roseibium sp. Sym1]|uniref:GntR family transcriptional regulator n=1 Tax=Roseibium sp. Sym1 TaxID=3016006 RepID=UPI0022B5C4C8|nr:GntR family transcriptional regulator [Roseibium sp. Sym1]